MSVRLIGRQTSACRTGVVDDTTYPTGGRGVASAYLVCHRRLERQMPGGQGRGSCRSVPVEN